MSPAPGPFTGRIHSLRLGVPGAELMIVGRACLRCSTDQARSHKPTLVAPLRVCMSRQALLGQCAAAPARVPASSGDDCGSSATRARIFSIAGPSGIAAMVLTRREAGGRERRLTRLRAGGRRLYGDPPRPAGSGRRNHSAEDPPLTYRSHTLIQIRRRKADLEVIRK